MYIFFRKNVKEDPAEIVSGCQTQADIRQGHGRHPGAVPGALLRHRGGEDTTHTDIYVPEGGSQASSTETETSAGVHDEASQEEVGRVSGRSSEQARGGPTT